MKGRMRTGSEEGVERRGGGPDGWYRRRKKGFAYIV